MKFPDGFIEKRDILYYEKLEALKIAAQVAENALNDIDLKKIKKKEYKKVIALDLFHYGQSLLLFRSKSVMLRLKRFGLTESELDRFISFDQINKAFDKIMSKGIKIDRLFVLEKIITYLKEKFRDDILRWALGEVEDDGTKMSKYTKDLILLDDRRKANKSNMPKTYSDEFEIFMNSLYNFMEQDTSGEISLHKIILTLKGGNGPLILKDIIEEGFDKSLVSKSDFLCTIYDLFYIFLKYDNSLDKDEAQFDSRKVGIYDRDFNKYRKARLRKIINYDSKLL